MKRKRLVPLVPAVLTLLAALLVLVGPRPSAAQEAGAARGGTLGGGPAVAGRTLFPLRTGGLSPLAARVRARPLFGRNGSEDRSFPLAAAISPSADPPFLLPVPVAGHCFPLCGAPGSGGRPGGTGPPDRGKGHAEGASPDRQEPERASRPAGGTPEPICVEVHVRMAPGTVFRLRVDARAVGARRPDEVERAVRTAMERGGVLSLEGLDGASIHVPASRVRGFEVERCAGEVIR